MTKRKKLFMFSLVPAHFVRPHEPLSWFYLGFIQKLIQKPNVKLWSKGGNSAHWQDIASSESMVFPASSFFVPPPFTVDPCGWLDQSNQCYFYLVNPMKPRIVDRHCHHPLRMGHWETVAAFWVNPHMTLFPVSLEGTQHIPKVSMSHLQISTTWPDMVSSWFVQY